METFLQPYSTTHWHTNPDIHTHTHRHTLGPNYSKHCRFPSHWSNRISENSVKFISDMSRNNQETRPLCGWDVTPWPPAADLPCHSERKHKAEWLWLVQLDVDRRRGWSEGKAGRGEFPEMKGCTNTDRDRHTWAHSHTNTRIISTAALTAISRNEG